MLISSQNNTVKYIGIFFVINLVAGVVIAFIGITPITYVMITSVQALILGIR